MTQYRRYRLQGGSYFVTVVTADRTRSLLTEHIVLLREAFREVRARNPFAL